MKTIDMLVALLLVVGGVNWGLVGTFNVDLVAAVFGEMSLVSRLVYLVVGACALYQIAGWKAIQRRWAYAQSVH